jgi:hypothetical protein
VPTADFRDAVAEILELWHLSAANVGAEAVALALVTAAKCEHDHRHEETVEVVWTGPEPAETRFRQTEQAILEVVNSATKRLTIVSYAVYRIPRIRESLVAAASRGVCTRLIVETPNRIEGQGEYDCLLALGANVASACSVYSVACTVIVPTSMALMNCPTLGKTSARCSRTRKQFAKWRSMTTHAACSIGRLTLEPARSARGFITRVNSKPKRPGYSAARHNRADFLPTSI